MGVFGGSLDERIGSLNALNRNDCAILEVRYSGPRRACLRDVRQHSHNGGRPILGRRALRSVRTPAGAKISGKRRVESMIWIALRSNSAASARSIESSRRKRVRLKSRIAVKSGRAPEKSLVFLTPPAIAASRTCVRLKWAIIFPSWPTRTQQTSGRRSSMIGSVSPTIATATTLMERAWAASMKSFGKTPLPAMRPSVS